MLKIKSSNYHLLEPTWLARFTTIHEASYHDEQERSRAHDQHQTPSTHKTASNKVSLYTVSLCFINYNQNLYWII